MLTFFTSFYDYGNFTDTSSKQMKGQRPLSHDLTGQSDNV